MGTGLIEAIQEKIDIVADMAEERKTGHLGGEVSAAA